MSNAKQRITGTQEEIYPATPREFVRLRVSPWEGVSVHEHRFGGIEFRVGHRELGHLHTTFADLPFPRRIRDELIAKGQAKPHHVLPQSGWVTVPMRNELEAVKVIELFRMNYERAMKAQERVAGSETPSHDSE